MTISNFRSQAKPLGSTQNDWSYFQRQKRTAWLSLLFAAGKLLRAETAGEEQQAKRDLKTYFDRIESLGTSEEELP